MANWKMRIANLKKKTVQNELTPFQSMLAAKKYKKKHLQMVSILIELEKNEFKKILKVSLLIFIDFKHHSPAHRKDILILGTTPNCVDSNAPPIVGRSPPPVFPKGV
jgi:hypothetical protein